MPGSGRFWLLPTMVVVLVMGGCRPRAAVEPRPDAPVVRVLVLSGLSEVQLSAIAPPVATTTSHPQRRRLNFPRGSAVTLSLSEEGWKIGNVLLGQGELRLEPKEDGTLRFNNQAWRGRFVLVPTRPDRFDVVNHVDIDSYLKSVVSRELLYHWNEQAYLAQAIAARTYALYEANTAPAQRHYDVFADQRSQMYGGIDAESRKSIHAVEQTAGVVLAYGPPDRLRIFKAYYSACCGGATLSVGDAFNEPNITPLWEQHVGSLCNPSPRFNWGPVRISKQELTRRIRGYGMRRDRPERSIQALARIDIDRVNAHGRPTRFILTDSNGARYSIGPEELRNAINHDAGKGPTVYSGFFRPINEAQFIVFAEGHGHGHGVGMCQWCAQVRASQGMRHEQILMLAYPESRLVRAY